MARDRRKLEFPVCMETKQSQAAKKDASHSPRAWQQEGHGDVAVRQVYRAGRSGP